MNKNLLYRSIPKVDVLLEDAVIVEKMNEYGRDVMMDAIRTEMDALRAFIGACESEEKAQKQIAELKDRIVARAKKALLNNPRHLVLEAAHPSPLSAYNGFFGCGHFIKTNEYLIKHGLTPIDWSK